MWIYTWQENSAVFFSVKQMAQSLVKDKAFNACDR